MAKQDKISGVNPLDTAASAVGHLYEAKERLKDAASAATDAVRSAASAATDAVRSAASSAASAAREDFAAGREQLREPLADAAAAGRTAAAEARDAAAAEFDVLVNKGKDLWGSAEGMIRQHPVAAFGTALAVGWLFAKLTRRS